MDYGVPNAKGRDTPKRLAGNCIESRRTLGRIVEAEAGQRNKQANTAYSERKI